MERHAADDGQHGAETRAAQARILKKYGLLLDLSDVDESIIQKLNKKRLPALNEELTWNQWCNKLFGDACRPRAVHLETVTGNTRMFTVKHRMAQMSWLTDELMERDQLLKDQEKRISELEKEKADFERRAYAVERLSYHRMSGFYFSVVEQLLREIKTIEDVEGDYRESTSRDNKAIRENLARLIAGGDFRADFVAELELVDKDRKEPFKKREKIIISRIESRWRMQESTDGNEDKELGWSFEVKGLQWDVVSFMGGVYEPVPNKYVETNYDDVKLDVRFELFGAMGVDLDNDELNYLTEFYRKLFLAVLRAGDLKRRAAIREEIMLACFWAWTAPGMPLHQLSDKRQHVEGLYERYPGENKVLPAAVFERFVSSVDDVFEKGFGSRVLRDWRC